MNWTKDQLVAHLSELMPPLLERWRLMMIEYPEFIWTTSAMPGLLSDTLASQLAVKMNTDSKLDGAGADLLNIEVGAGKKGPAKSHPEKCTESRYYLWVRRTQLKAELNGWMGQIEVLGKWVSAEDFRVVSNGKHGSNLKGGAKGFDDVLWSE